MQDYKVGRCVGQGSFGRVYKAKCVSNGAWCALKVISKADAKEKKLEARVINEIDLHYQLKHPNVVRLHHFFETESHIYMVLEYCKREALPVTFRDLPSPPPLDGDLQAYLKKRGSLSVPEVRHFFHQVVCAVVFLHHNRVLHRDLKLSNLLLAKGNVVKLADFGLAKSVKPDTCNLTMCGSPNYISPEVVTKQPHSFPADMWSLGCVLYSLLCGTTPFATKDVQDTLSKVAVGDFKLSSRLDPLTRDLVYRLLKKNPLDRIALEDILKHPFMLAPDHRSATTPNHPQQQHGLVGTAPTQHNHGNDDAQATSPSISTSHRVQDEHAPQVVHSSGAVNAVHIGVQTESPKKEQSLSESDAGRDSSLPKTSFPEVPPMLTSESPVLSRSRAATREPLGVIPTTVSVGSYSTSTDTPAVELFPPIDTPQCLSERLPRQRRSSDHLQVKPLNTYRLPQVSHLTKEGDVEVTEDGNVRIRFTKDSSVFQVSRDGQQVQTTTDGEVWDEYTLETLPNYMKKKYLYASRIVDVIKSRTPMVVLNTNNARAMLMENHPDPDFTVKFRSGVSLRFPLSSSVVTVRFSKKGLPHSFDLASFGTNKENRRESWAQTHRPRVDPVMEAVLKETLDLLTRCRNVAAEAERCAVEFPVRVDERERSGDDTSCSFLNNSPSMLRLSAHLPRSVDKTKELSRFERQFCRRSGGGAFGAVLGADCHAESDWEPNEETSWESYMRSSSPSTASAAAVADVPHV